MSAAPIMAAPVWGYLTDKTERRRLVLFILTIGSSASIFSLPWVSESMHPNYTTSNLTTTNATIGGSNSDKKHKVLFCTLLGISTLASVFLRPLTNYIEAIIFDVVKSVKDEASYGRQRFICAISIGLTTCIAEQAVENNNQNNDSSLSPYITIFYIFLPVTLLVIPLGCYLIKQIEENEFKSPVTESDTNTGSHQKQADSTATTSDFDNLVVMLLRHLIQPETCFGLTLLMVIKYGARTLKRSCVKTNGEATA